MAASNEGTAMTKDHLTSFGYRWVGLLCALLMSLLVAGCGGGGGGSNGDVNTAAEFLVTPTEIKTGPNTVWTFTMSGGVRPYRAKSSSPLVVLEKETLALNEYTVNARTLDPNGEAVVTVAFFDINGKSKSATITINSATASTLSALPATLTVYHNTPALVTASGGQPPYRLLSGNPAIIPTSSWSQTGDFLVLAQNVAAELEVPLTIQDSSGQSAPITATVRPAPLLNVFTIASVPASPGVGCGTAVCSGQDGTASVTLRSFEGAPLSGRQVRFDVVQGEYLFYSGNPAQPFIATTTVTSDQNGFALVRFKANTNAVTGAALIKATDLITGNNVVASFVIAQFTDGTGTLSIIPDEVEITMRYNDECSVGVSSTYYIFGGTPPYRVVTSFPDGVLLSGVPVQTNGGGFTATTRGACMDPADLVVTDATARTLTALLRNKPGDEDRPAVVEPPPALAVTPAGPIGNSTTSGLTCGQTAGFIITGGASTTFAVATNDPSRITATLSGNALSVMRNGSTPVVNATPVETRVYVSDGTSIYTLVVWVPTTCT